MREIYCGNEYRSTLVCVDSYENCELCGHLYHPSHTGAVAFKSMMQLLLELETLLDGMDFPQAYTTKRSFQTAGSTQNLPQEALRERRGRKATFVIKVLFRQNASWQGSLTWVNEGREESFRSVLELLLLMHSVLAEQGHEEISNV